MGARREAGDSRSLPVAHNPMVLVILNMWVMSVGSKSLSCEWKEGADRGSDLGSRAVDYRSCAMTRRRRGGDSPESSSE